MTRENIEEKLEKILGTKKDGKYSLQEKLSIKVEEQKGSIFLWIEDRRGEVAYAWSFDVFEKDKGYRFYCDKESIECDTLEQVLDIVKEGRN